MPKPRYPTADDLPSTLAQSFFEPESVGDGRSMAKDREPLPRPRLDLEATRHGQTHTL